MDSNQRFLSPYCQSETPVPPISATVILAQQTGARSPCAAPDAEPFRIAERPASHRRSQSEAMTAPIISVKTKKIRPAMLPHR